jgi:hypothetical protein
MSKHVEGGDAAARAVRDLAIDRQDVRHIQRGSLDTSMPDLAGVGGADVCLIPLN